MSSEALCGTAENLLELGRRTIVGRSDKRSWVQVLLAFCTRVGRQETMPQRQVEPGEQQRSARDPNASPCFLYSHFPLFPLHSHLF